MTGNKDFYMLIGIPGSGKSTYVKNNFNMEEIVYICPDEIRKEITGDINDMSQDRRVFMLVDKRLKSALKKGDKTIVYDATNYIKKYRKATLKKVKEAGYTSHAINIVTSLALCIFRQYLRERVIPLDVMINKFYRLVEYVPIDSDEFDDVKFIDTNVEQDFDVIISNSIGERLKEIDDTSKDHSDFYQNMKCFSDDEFEHKTANKIIIAYIELLLNHLLTNYSENLNIERLEHELGRVIASQIITKP